MSPTRLDILSVFVPDYNPSTVGEMNKAQVRNLGLTLSMTIQLAGESLALFRQGRYAEFDGSIGNFGCQNLALYLLGLARSPAFRAEAEALLPCCSSPVPFDQRYQAAPLRVSEEMANLIRCRLLAMVSEAATEENINSELRCDDKKLRIRFGISGGLARKVINLAKERLSADTIAYTQCETDRIRSLPDRERALLQGMVRKIVVLPSQGAFLTFASTSSTLKALFCRIMETGAVVALKKLCVSENPPPPLYYRFDNEMRKFRELDPNTLNPMEPVVLLEAKFRDDAMDTLAGRESVRERLDRYGLDRATLACGAQSPQFVPSRPDIFPRLRDFFAEAEFALAEGERRQLIAEADAMECNLSRSPFFDPNHLSLSSVAEQQRMVTAQERV